MSVDVSIHSALGEDTILMTRVGTPTQGKRLICYAHGSGQTATESLMTYIDNRQTMLALAESGLPVLAITGELTGFGNNAGKAKWDSAIAAVEAIFGVRTDGVLWYGGSMGAATAFDHWKIVPAKTKAIATIIGLVDMQDFIENDRISEPASALVRAAYGAANDAAMAAHYPTRSPWHFRDDVRDAITAGTLAVQSWGSSNDPYCIPSIAQAFATHCGFQHNVYGAYGHAGPGVALPDAAAWLYSQR